MKKSFIFIANNLARRIQMTDYNNLPIIIGKKLKRIIKEKGYTQVEFASLVGVEQSTLRRWLAYGVDSIDKLDRSAKLLNIPIGDFFVKDV